MTDKEESQIRRIKAPCVDNSALIKENALTLIGRVTNPKEQRIWALLPALPRKWHLQGRATGSDLGNGCFQYRFEREEDLQNVLDNRPYHFAYWMVIIQKWEPIISPSFPSQIPFWIRIKGLPLHFWFEDMIRDIGKDLGLLLKHELTKTTARVKVLLDGLKPLTKKAIIEYDSGEESMVYLEYERLENHCSGCNALTHLKKDCPLRADDLQLDTIKEKEARINEYAEQRGEYRSRRPTETPYRAKEELPTYERGHKDTSKEVFHREAFHERLDRHGVPFGNRVATKQTRVPPPPKSLTTIRDEGLSWRNKAQAEDMEKSVYNSPPYTKRREMTKERNPHLRAHFPQRSFTEWRAKPPIVQICSTPGSDDNPNESQDPAKQNEQSQQVQVSPTNRTELQILEEINEATQRYLNCPDPTEAAARRQRVMSGDVRGHTEQEVATRIMRQGKSKESGTTSNQDQLTTTALTKETVLQDLQDVTLQYLSCADPVEAAARRQRVIEGDAEGLMEKTAESILAASSEQRRPLSPWERGIKSVSPPGIDFDAAMQPSDKEDTPPPVQEKAKRSKKKTQSQRGTNGTPNILNGTSSRKRNISQMKPSPVRSKNSPDRKKQKGTAPNYQADSSTVPIEEGRNPPIHLIPAISKKKPDFRPLPHQAP